MKLTHLDLTELKLSSLNVRKKGGKGLDDLLPSIRSLGLIQPLLVRPNCEGFEIIAGQRRYHALLALKKEGIADPVPCAIMEDGDDAKAIEASLAENVARLPMDEIDQYKAFAALIDAGESIEGIASCYGVTERLVRQRLAIAGIIEPILNAYRREDIRPETLRALTMATKRQQQAWWKLFKTKGQYAPEGRALKDWLFGGAQIPLANALFDIAEYAGPIVSDLFGEERYFGDSAAFWELQNMAIAAKRDAYVAAGWAEVVLLDVGKWFTEWEHVKTPKKKGGKVVVAIASDGEVEFHEGWLTEKEAKHKENDRAKPGQVEDAPLSPANPELTAKMRNYIGLHKHAAVRTELLAHPKIALRLAVAHLIAGSGLWSVKPDPQRADSAEIAASLADALATKGFAEEQARIGLLLGFDAEEETIVSRSPGWGDGRSIGDIFESLMHTEDETVLRVLTFVMAETLEAGSGVVEALGALFHTDMRNWWKPDETFFALLRDKSAINDMVREVAGDIAADAHVTSTAKVQKKIIADCLTGAREAQVKDWLPRYMTFPEGTYRAAADTMDEPQVAEEDEAGFE